MTWAATPDDIVADPQLGADGHPLAGSPAIGTGLDVGYGTTISAFGVDG